MVRRRVRSRGARGTRMIDVVAPPWSCARSPESAALVVAVGSVLRFYRRPRRAAMRPVCNEPLVPSDGKPVHRVWLVTIAAILTAAMGVRGAQAQGSSSPPVTQDPRTLDERLLQLKEETLLLNRNLSTLQDDLQSPGETIVTVYLTLQTAESLVLDSMAVWLDGQIIAGDFYAPVQIVALRAGGVRRLFAGPVRSGSHHLEARIVAVRAGGVTVRKSTTLDFVKGKSSRTFLMTVSDQQGSAEPSLRIENRDQ